MLTSLLPCWATGHLHPSLEAHLLSPVTLPSLLNPGLVAVPSQIPSARQRQCSLLFLALRYITFPCQFPLTLLTSLQRVPSVDMTVTFTCQRDWATGAQTFGQSVLWLCLCRCFWMRWTFEHIPSEAMSLPSVGGLHPIS